MVRKQAPKPKESDLYQPIKEYLEMGDWVVYSEVEEKRGYRRADIVATRGNQLMVVEMKTTLSFKLLEQAIAWKGSADYIYIAVPRSKVERSWIAMEVLERYGIGIIEIDYGKYILDKEREKRTKLGNIKQKLTFGIKASPPKKLLVTKRTTFDNLTEEHKTWALGGSASGNGKYVTSYSLLMFDVYAYLRSMREKDISEGWVSVDDIWNHLKLTSKPKVVKHYARPKPSIVKALQDFENADVESIRMGNKRYFRIMEGSTKYIFEEENNA